MNIQSPQKYCSAFVKSLLLVVIMYFPQSSFGTMPVRQSLAASNVVVGYWHNWNLSSVPAIKLADVPSYYNVVCVAFVTSASPSDMTMSFSPDPGIETDAQFIADVKTLQARGKKVIISLGGQNGTVILTSDTEKQKFIQSMDAIIKKYGFNGLDLDLENGDVQLGAGDTDFRNPVSPRLVNLMNAVRTLRTNNGGANFWVTAAPEIAYVQGGISAFAGIWGAYLPVLYGLRDILTYVHVQYYNCGSNTAPDGRNYTQGTADFIVAMTDMLIGGFGLAGSTTNIFPGFAEGQVAFGLPATTGAAGGGYTQFSEVVKALDYLTKGTSFGGQYVIRKAGGYPGLRGIMTWSINWDNTNSYTFGKTFSAYFGINTPVAPPRAPLANSVPRFVVAGDKIILSADRKPIAVEIVAMNGTSVKSVSCPQREISLQGIPGGVYMLRVTDGSSRECARFFLTTAHR
jgi:chitinase